MKAVLVEALDGPQALQVRDLPQPEHGPDQVLIDVAYAGVTFPDLLLTRGLYQVRPPLPFTPGSEVSGTVVFAPEGSDLQPGDRVLAFSLIGGFAEQLLVSDLTTFVIPDNVSLEAAAAIPMNYFTMQFGLVRRGGIRPGDRVLVHGAAGGIGTASIQLAKMYGAEVIAVVSTPEKGEVALAAGADHAVAAEGFLEEVRSITRGEGVDIVVDPVGGDRFTDSLRSLAPEGRLLVVGFTGGEIPTVKVNRLLLNNIGVLGVGWGAFLFKHPDSVTAQWADISRGLESGALDPVLGQTFDLDDAAQAVSSIEQRAAMGKQLIRCSA